MLKQYLKKLIINFIKKRLLIQPFPFNMYPMSRTVNKKGMY